MERSIRRRNEPGLTKFQDAVSDLFNRFFEGWDLGTEMEGRTWWPLLDVAEREDELIVKADLPGMKAQDIDIHLEGNVLTLSGQKTAGEEEKDENLYRCERRYGSFRRSITLPSTVDAEKIEASYDNGVLTVVVPKSEAAKPKKIKVQEHQLTA